MVSSYYIVMGQDDIFTKNGIDIFDLKNYNFDFLLFKTLNKNTPDIKLI